MDYQEAVRFHEEAKQFGSVLGLSNMTNLMRELGQVQNRLKIVHIGGTNGKGSVSCFIASVLKEGGYRVGQFQSPAVFSDREVFSINGEAISKEEYAAIFTQVREACERMVFQGESHPTVFEIETAAAFLWFYQKKCDIVLLEVGMGGETDATNIISHSLCSVFVSVSRDHMGFLGNSLKEIAEVKSGIIKKGQSVISAHQSEEVSLVLQKKAAECHSKLLELSDDYQKNIAYYPDNIKIYDEKYGEIKLSMLGAYQGENAMVALQAIKVLENKGFPVRREQVVQGMYLAHWSGRMECLKNEPLFYIDGAHNLDAIKKLKQTLTNIHMPKPLIGIMGVMADKEYVPMLAEIVECFDMIYTVKPDNERALPAQELKKAIERISDGRVMSQAVPSVREAVALAYEEAMGKKGSVLAFGSLYYLKEVKQSLLSAEKEDTL